MTRTQVSFQEPLYREARRYARAQGISFAELCRRAIARVLSERRTPEGRPWMKYAGVLRSGDLRASRSVDAVVYARERP